MYNDVRGLIPYINFYYCRSESMFPISPSLIPYINFYYCRSNETTDFYRV